MFPPTDKNIYLVVDNPSVYKMAGSSMFLVGIVCEPEAIAHGRDQFIKNPAQFDLILTFDEEILRQCPNARMCIYGTAWIPKTVYENIDVSRKRATISCLTGSKEVTPAHTYRKFLYSNQLRIPLPITWFRSSKGALLPAYQHNPIIQDEKCGMFLDYQYSIAIENSRQNHYFTEKLLDCLVTKTIPIYYGCPNIAEYFDTRGWILLETTNIDEFVYKVHNFLPKYEECTDTIEHNYREAKKYTIYSNNIQRAMNLGA
jgi:hypothetical protein